MHRSRGLPCSLKMSSTVWVAILMCILALSLGPTGVETKSVEQQELLSCEHVSSFFSSINVTIKPANKNQESQYCPPGTLFYPSNPPPPTNPQDNRQPQPQIIYPPYQGNLAMPIRQAYHVDMPPQQGPPPPTPQKVPELGKAGPGPGNVYHITLDQQGMPQPPQNPGPPPQLKAITIEKIPQDRGVPYHIELKHDDRKDLRQPQPPPQQPPQQTSHLPEGIVYNSALRPGGIPMHAIASNQQMPKGGSITQGYPPARPPPISNSQQPQPPQIHYQRHRY